MAPKTFGPAPAVFTGSFVGVGAWRIVVRFHDGRTVKADATSAAHLHWLVERALRNPDVVHYQYFRLEPELPTHCPRCGAQYHQGSVHRLPCNCGFHLRHRCRKCFAPEWFDPPLEPGCDPPPP